MSILVQVASFSVQLEARTRRGAVAFSLTNTGAAAAALRLAPLALSPELGGCLTPEPAQVTLAPGTTTMVQMRVAAPELLAAGSYLVRLSLVPVAGGGGVSSSDVTVVVPEHPAGPPPDARPQPFPWWLVIVGGAVLLLLIGLLVWLTLGRGGATPTPGEQPKAGVAAPGDPATRPAPDRAAALRPAAAEPVAVAPARAAEAALLQSRTETAAAAARAKAETGPVKGATSPGKTAKPDAVVTPIDAPPTFHPTKR